MTKTERIENFVKTLKTRKSKNIIYTIVIALIVSAFAYRFYSVAQENRLEVFNIARNNAQNGTPVNVLEMQKTDGILYEPVTIKNNRAYVSGARVGYFKSGQKIGNCKIVSVSKDIDLDTGMYVIKTSSCPDGLQYAENKKNGFYVPVSAIRSAGVYVVNDGRAQFRQIKVENQDAENALVKSGIETGDTVILSHISDNEKVKIEK